MSTRRPAAHAERLSPERRREHHRRARVASTDDPAPLGVHLVHLAATASTPAHRRRARHEHDGADHDTDDDAKARRRLRGRHGFVVIAEVHVQRRLGRRRDGGHPGRVGRCRGRRRRGRLRHLDGGQAPFRDVHRGDHPGRFLELRQCGEPRAVLRIRTDARDLRDGTLDTRALHHGRDGRGGSNHRHRVRVPGVNCDLF